MLQGSGFRRLIEVHFMGPPNWIGFKYMAPLAQEAF